MSQAFLMSLLAKKRVELGDEFLRQFSHPWLVWEADAWAAPSRDGATRVIAGGGPRPHVEARESLCYALTMKPGRTLLKVGRLSELDVVINDGTVSRNHAVLFPDERQQWVMQVVSASARTLHQDRLLAKGSEVRLRDGDRVEFGDVRLRFFSPVTLSVLLSRQPTAIP